MRPVPNHTIRDGHDTSFNLTPPEQFVPNTMKLAVNARLKRFDIFIIVGVDSDFNLFFFIFSHAHESDPILSVASRWINSYQFISNIQKSPARGAFEIMISIITLLIFVYL